MQRYGDWTITIKEGFTVLSPDEKSVYSFDLEGRPISWSEKGEVFKRSLASRVFGRRRVDGERHRWELEEEDIRRWFRRLLQRVGETPGGLVKGTARDRLDAVLRWTPDTLVDERRRFEAAYRPIGILPPDQYFSVVLQATFGCSWNRCTFCDFYQGHPFSARSQDDFEAHVQSVADLLGRARKMRRGIFLSDGNALILSNDRLRPLFETARSAFPGFKVHAFVDVFNGERKPEEGWRELVSLGLDRVHVGLETGHDPLLAWLEKPGSAGEAAALVETLKRAGLLVAVIFMVGAGGERFAADHVRDTLELSRSLPLEKGDIVYLSPFVPHAGSEYDRRAREEDVRPLQDAETQYRVLREGVLRAHPGVKAARYDIREFVY